MTKNDNKNLLNPPNFDEYDKLKHKYQKRAEKLKESFKRFYNVTSETLNKRLTI